MKKVLLITSTRAADDIQEVLRIQDTINALRSMRYSVDLLTPRLSNLLDVAVDLAARVFVMPRIPFCGKVPPRASLRRFALSALMALRGAVLVACNKYTLLHGFNDGALIARSITRLTFSSCPYIAEFHTPFAGASSSDPRVAFARSQERRAFRKAAAIILPDAETLERFGSKLSRARVSLIPNARIDFAPDAFDDFTVGDFNAAIAHVYEYVLRSQSKD